VFYELFYKDKVKVVPDNIYDILTPIALAHWPLRGGARRARAN
jgi:hypothetical protein